jgi:hypothetical protein
MPPVPQTAFSFLTFFTLLVVLAASGVTFWLLVRRATSHRQWVALSDWARSRGFRYHPIADGEPPAPFSVMPGKRPSARLWLASRTAELLQMRFGEEPIATAPAPTASASASASASAIERAPETWHVLIRQVESNWPPTALRPTTSSDVQTMLDNFGLASFPSMIASERFVIFGADSAAARSLSKSSLPALLPPDVGLLLHGRRMVLDFSRRPFDTIEFDRMLGLADHLTAHLPALKK